MPPIRQEVEFKPQCFSRGALALSWTLRFCLKVIFRLTRVKVIGAENIPKRGALVVVVNHVTVLDPVFMFGILPYRPASFLAMAELWKIPVVGRFASYIGLIPVERGSAASKARAMVAAGKVLKHSGLVVIYPQGHIEPQGEIIDWFVGSFRMGVPVIPIGTNGTTSVRSGRLFAPVTIKVGRPISPEHFKTAQAFADATKSVVGALSS